tara:strand:- start:680 stop:847 length:168 start_codon:yes stop_codon:yes gene_type:complete
MVLKKLTNKQQVMLRNHSKHHTAAHMTAMKRKMVAGMSFTQAHNQVMKMKMKHKK